MSLKWLYLDLGEATGINLAQAPRIKIAEIPLSNEQTQWAVVAVWTRLEMRDDGRVRELNHQIAIFETKLSGDRGKALAREWMNEWARWMDSPSPIAKVSEFAALAAHYLKTREAKQ